MKDRHLEASFRSSRARAAAADRSGGGADGVDCVLTADDAAAGVLRESLAQR
jgi:hypothetical protein